MLFSRSNVCDRNAESHGPEGEPDGLLCYCSSDGFLQRHPEHHAVGSWSFQGVRLSRKPPTISQVFTELSSTLLFTRCPAWAGNTCRSCRWSPATLKTSCLGHTTASKYSSTACSSCIANQVQWTTVTCERSWGSWSFNLSFYSSQEAQVFCLENNT